MRGARAEIRRRLAELRHLAGSEDLGVARQHLLDQGAAGARHAENKDRHGRGIARSNVTTHQFGRERRLGAAGLDNPVQFDIWTAIVGGLAAQQTANDPGGKRWLRLIDEVVDIYADHVLGKSRTRRRR